MDNILTLDFSDIMKQLVKYNLGNKFSSKQELNKWLLELNDLEKQNILSLNIEPKDIKFNPKLLINKNLLNTTDYIKRIETFINIKNAEGYYHLFDRMLSLEFLHSDKFYQDIEVLKRAKCAQTPLWIIGEPVFIYSPFHDEDLELLVTAKDTSDECFDYVVWDAIATVAENYDSIYSGYHQSDLQIIIKYGATSLQMSNSFPESGINYLAINSVSLKDPFHTENMEILAENQEIGNFLYAVMTNEVATKRNDYRTIIREMIENKDNKYYVFLLCYHAVGEKEAISAQNILICDYFKAITKTYDMKELIQSIVNLEI